MEKKLQNAIDKFTAIFETIFFFFFAFAYSVSLTDHSIASLASVHANGKITYFSTEILMDLILCFFYTAFIEKYR